MKNIKESKLFKLIKDEIKRGTILSCISFVENIWKSEKLIQYFTDHNIDHSYRILGIIEKLPNFTKCLHEEDEIYALLLGVFLHDIGMQCDIRKHKEIQEHAREKYDAVFNEEYLNERLTLKQQEEIRKNHHLLTAAWISKAYNQDDRSSLTSAIENIPHSMVQDIIDICRYHSKLDINDCEKKFSCNYNLDKRFIVATLRLGDELDINNERVTMKNAKDFFIPDENLIHWYLHDNTIVDVEETKNETLINIRVSLRPDAFKKYGKSIDILYQDFVKKNEPLIYIIKDRYRINFKEKNDFCRSYDYATLIPQRIMNFAFNIINTPLLAGNERFNELAAEYSIIDSEYQEIYSLSKERPTDYQLKSYLVDHNYKKERIKKEIQEVQREITNIANNISKAIESGQIDNHYTIARHHIEKGDFKSAKDELSFDDLCRDSNENTEKLQLFRRSLKANVNNFLLRAYTFIMDYNDPNRLIEIDKSFEKAINLEVHHKLGYNAQVKYAQYQYDQNDYGKIEKLLVPDIEEEIDREELSALYNLKAIYFEDTDSYKESEILFQKAIVIKEGLKNKVNLAVGYKNLAGLYEKIKNYLEAEKLYKKALLIDEELYHENSLEYSASFAISCNNYAGICRENGRYEESKNLYLKAYEIGKRLEQDEEADLCKILLSTICSNLAGLYFKLKKHNEAKELFENAFKIDECLYKINPTAYETFLTIDCNNLAGLYLEVGEYDKADELLRRVCAIDEKLAKENPQVYEAPLAVDYNNMASLLYKTKCFKKAEEFFKKCLRLYRSLSSRENAVYETTLAISYGNLAALYHTLEQYEKAEKYYKKAIIINEKMVQMNPIIYMGTLAHNYKNLCRLYKETRQNAKYNEFVDKNMSINKRLEMNNIDIEQVHLATSYNNLVFFFYKDNQETVKLYRKTLYIDV